LTPFIHPVYGLHGIVKGSTILYFAMIGYDFISTISEEAKNTKIEAPLAMIDTVVVCVSIYIVIAISMCGMGFG
jgi:basic amino acid/polyamine antiporter, APA family